MSSTTTIAPSEPSVARNPSADAGRLKLVPLTSLRFFAAFYVLVFHSLFLEIKPESVNPILRNFVNAGFTSVGFFFVLSGFILAVVYLSATGDVKNRRDFFVARFARIYPLYFLTLCADTPFILADRIHLFGVKTGILKVAVTFIGNVFMLQAWAPPLNGIDTPNWSLSTEAILYLSFPFLGVWLWRSSKARAVGFVAVLYVATMALSHVIAGHLSESKLGWVKFDPLFHIAEFAIGVVAAKFFNEFRKSEDGRSHFEKLAPALRVGALLVMLAIVLAPRGLTVFMLLWSGLLAPIFAILILGCSSQKGGMVKFLSHPWLEVLGESSYGLYLIHFVIWHCVETAGYGRNLALWPVYLVVCIAVSVVSHYCIERPARTWILDRVKRRRPALA